MSNTTSLKWITWWSGASAHMWLSSRGLWTVTVCKLVFEILTTVLLNSQIFWDVTLKVQALRTFKMPRTICPGRQHHIPQVLSHPSKPHQTGSSKCISPKYSKMQKQGEEVMQNGWFKTEIWMEKWGEYSNGHAKDQFSYPAFWLGEVHPNSILFCDLHLSVFSQ